MAYAYKEKDFSSSRSVSLHVDQARATSPYVEIYHRATNEFAAVDFFKPAETRTNDLSFTMAPLILQQVNDAKEPLSKPTGLAR